MFRPISTLALLRPGCTVLAASLLAACPSPADDTDTDSDTDTDTDTDTEEQPVEVRIEDDGAPYVGTSVVFHDAEGAVLGVEATDNQGLARWSDFPDGGGVTLVLGDDATLITRMGLLGGDAFVVDLNTSMGVEVDVALPGTYGQADFYELYSCSGHSDLSDPTQAVTPTAPAACIEGGSTPFVGVAYERGEPVAWTVAPQVDVEASGVTVLPDWEASISTFDLQVQGLPGATAVDVSMQQGVSPFAMVSASEDVTSEGSMSLPLLDGVDVVGTSVRTQVDWPGLNSSFATRIDRYAAPGPAQVTYDVAADVWPTLREVEVSTTDGTLAWAWDGDAPQVDALSATLRWADDDGTDWSWWIAGPGDVPSPWTLPRLPEDVVVLSTDPSDLAAGTRLTLFSIDDLDYADIRTWPVPLVVNLEWSLHAPTVVDGAGAVTEGTSG